MTAEQEIKAAILAEAREAGPWKEEAITEESVDRLWDALVDEDIHWDYRSEFRCSGEATGLPAPYSRHYEGDAVARKMPSGKWVGWTYWHGGGKHGDPEAIDWMDEAYFVNVTEEEKMVVVRSFAKADEPA